LRTPTPFHTRYTANKNAVQYTDTLYIRVGAIPIRRPVSPFQKKQLTNLLLIAGNVEFPSKVKCVVLIPNASNQQLLKLPLEMLDNCTFVANKPLIVSLKPGQVNQKTKRQVR